MKTDLKEINDFLRYLNSEKPYTTFRNGNYNSDTKSYDNETCDIYKINDELYFKVIYSNSSYTITDGDIVGYEFVRPRVIKATDFESI